jgi:hypothetical protein
MSDGKYLSILSLITRMLMDLNFSLDRVESGADVHSMIRTFTEAILEATAAAVPLVRPSCFCLALSPLIKSIIARKNGLRRVWQNSRNTQDRLEFETLNNLVRDLCRGMGNTAFGNKVRKLKPGHGSFWNFTKIIKNKFRTIPALKMDGLTLITS